MPAVPLTALVAAVLAVPLVLSPRITLTALVALGLMTAVIVHPPVAAYVLAGSTVLIAGINRGAVLPVLRPSEALTVLLGAALVVRALVRSTGSTLPRIRVTRIDAALILFAVTGSVVPLLWMVLRGEAVTMDDVLFALALWKVYAVFLIVRTSVSTEAQVTRCLWLSMSAAAVVAMVAIAQALDLFGVPDLVFRLFPPTDDLGLDPGRGSSTLGASLVTANVMAFNLAIALGCLARLANHRPVLLGAAVLFVFGGLASGQFSGVIGLVVVAVAVGVATRQLTRRLLSLLAVGLVAGILMQPVIERRLASFRTGQVPSSWLARLDNLRTYFWPKLFSDFNYVLGVRPAARVPYPGPGDIYVWIESGHTWLLWSGGLPMFAAFFVFLWTAMREVLHVARRRVDAIGAAGIAAFSGLAAVAVLMALDPQLTGRGEGELLFTIIALAVIAPRDRPSGRVGSPPSVTTGASR